MPPLTPEQGLEVLLNTIAYYDSNGNLVLRTSSPSPLAGYGLSDQDVGAILYYGYLDKYGNWYVQKGIVSGAVTNWTYAAGSSGYNFAGRAGLSYAAFNITF